MAQTRKTAMDPVTSMLFTCSVEPIASLRVTLLRRGEMGDAAAGLVTRPWPARPGASLEGTVRDPRFGKETHAAHTGAAHCSTCGHVWRRCVMHMGAIPLTEPIFNPAFFTALCAVVRALAPRPAPDVAADGRPRSGLLLPYEADAEQRERVYQRVRAAPPATRLPLLRKAAKVASRKGDTRGVTWRFDFGRGEAVAVEEFGADRFEVTLSAGKVHALLAALTPYDIETLGFDPAVVDPASLMFDHLPVMPAPACPSKLMDDGRAQAHFHLAQYNRIAAAEVAARDPVAPQARRGRRGAMTRDGVVHLAVAQLIDPKCLRRGKRAADEENAMQSLKKTLERKEGILRTDVLGKRIPSSARSIITPNPQLRHGEVGVPRSIAERMLVPEPINAWSRGLVSASQDLRVLTEQHTEQVRPAGAPLEDGCTLLRPLRSGDVVLFGRQPTMSNHSLCAMRVVVTDSDCITFNCNEVERYNADFDGDEMNILMPNSYESATELVELASPARGFLSDASGRPCMGAHQDCLLGIYLLTRPEVTLSRREMLRLMAAASWPALPEPTAGAPMWRGADAMQAALVPLGEQFRWEGANASVAGGRLIGGPLAKPHVAVGVGGLLHCVARTIGGDAALAFMDCINSLAHAFLEMRPPGMTAGDLVLRKNLPIDWQTLDERYAAASSRKAELAELEMRAATIHQQRVRPQERNTFTLLSTEAKCKGSEMNLRQLFGAVGVLQVDGAPPAHVGVGRALPVFRPHGRSPESHGMIDRSLLDGMCPGQNAIQTTANKVGLCSTVLNVPTSGYMQRRLTQVLKDCIVSFDGTVRSGRNIIQFAYGGDGAHAARAVRVTLTAAELAAARAEAEAGGDEALLDSVDIIKRTGLDLSLPVALPWLILQATKVSGGSEPPEEQDDAAVMAACRRIVPHGPATLTRCVVAVRLRRSERRRLGIRGVALAALLERIEEDWVESRVPAGYAAGVHVGTAVGPPLTQKRLDAFHTAGVQGGGVETAEQAARALDHLLNNTSPNELGSFGMTIFTEENTEAAAAALAAELPALRVSAFVSAGARLVAPGVLDTRAAVLWRALGAAAAHVAVVVPLDRAAMDRRMVTAADAAAAISKALRLPAVAWPLAGADPFVVAAVPNAKREASYLRAATSAVLRGDPRIVAAMACVDAASGDWVVETSGTNLVGALGTPGVDPRRTRSRSVRDTLKALDAEAAVHAAMREVRRLLGSTNVNVRHISLLADFMLHTGEPLAFNRWGMASSGDGPVARALFETPLDTLRDAALSGKVDELSSLLTQIMCGKVLAVGTGSTAILYDMGAT